MLRTLREYFMPGGEIKNLTLPGALIVSIAQFAFFAVIIWALDGLSRDESWGRYLILVFVIGSTIVGAAITGLQLLSLLLVVLMWCFQRREENRIGDPDDPEFRKGSRNILRISLTWRPLFILISGLQFFLPLVWHFFR